MSIKVLEKLNRIENELFNLKREIYKDTPCNFVFQDNPCEIKEIVQVVRQSRQKIWKTKYAGKI